jgi:hypothetical protein
MPNAFSKEERVAFEDILEGFNDALVMSKTVNVYKSESQMMERAGNTLWRPYPYIALSGTTLDVTSTVKDYVQLSVPATMNSIRNVAFNLDGLELRDMLQEKRLVDAAKQKLSSDINIAVNAAAEQGTMFVKRTGAATGFDDVAACDTLMNERGVPMSDRFIALNSRDYNAMAANLANRGTLQGKPLNAYDKAYIGNIAGFEGLKMDYAPAQVRTSATGAGVTLNAANQYYTPLAVSGGTNIDNRTQTITTTANANIDVGSFVTIAGVNSVHRITKQDTGNLMTFRVVSKPSGTTMVISPPIISGGGATAAELEYQNVSATPGTTAAITLLSTNAGVSTSAPKNFFYHKSSIELMPGRIAFPDNAGAQLMRGTTDQGFELVMMKQFNGLTGKTLIRVDTLFGANNLNPEMNGVMLFSQS